MIDGRRRVLVGSALGALIALPFVLRRAEAQPRKERVICVGGALTEIVYRLGAESLLVAADTTSFYPPAAQALPKVGYQRSLSAEGVLSLRPTVVLTTPDAGPPAAIEQLKSAGVRLVRTEEGHSFDALLRAVRTVADAIGRSADGARLADELKAQWLAAQSAIKARANAKPPRVLFVLSHSANVQVSGAGTAAHSMIELAGGVNALQGFNGYRPLSAEAVLAAAPDVILATQQGIEALGSEAALLARPGLALTPAGKARRVVAPDALYLLGFGPRLPQAVLDLAHAFGTA